MISYRILPGPWILGDVLLRNLYTGKKLELNFAHPSNLMHATEFDVGNLQVGFVEVKG